MIIVIDDNKDLASVTCELLNVMGYRATVALSGEEGIAKAKKQKPKIILCDIGMKGMDGYEVAKRIRADCQLKDVYLIAISGYYSPIDIDRSIEAGFDKHLPKPVDFNHLQEIMDKVIEKS